MDPNCKKKLPKPPTVPPYLKEHEVEEGGSTQSLHPNFHKALKYHRQQNFQIPKTTAPSYGRQHQLIHIITCVSPVQLISHPLFLKRIRKGNFFVRGKSSPLFKCLEKMLLLISKIIEKKSRRHQF